MSEPFWKSDSATVTAGYAPDGGLQFCGHDLRAFATPGHEYEYVITVDGAEFPAVRRALGVSEDADVLAAVLACVDDVMPGGEAAWLSARGIRHAVSVWDSPPN